MDFSLKQSEQYLGLVKQITSAHSYVLMNKKQENYPVMMKTDNIEFDHTEYQPVQMYEFGTLQGDQVANFNQTILPLFSSPKQQHGSYHLNGKKMIIGVSPVFLRMNYNPLFHTKFQPGLKVHLCSVGLIAQEHQLTRHITQLKSRLQNIILVGLLILFSVLIVIFVICYLLAVPLTRNIVKPLKRLLNIVVKLGQGDFLIDIEEHYRTKGYRQLKPLYNVFNQLRVVKRFNQRQSFHQPAQAIITYAQAISLFKDFGNLPAVSLCYSQLGKLHFQAKRYHQATIAYIQAYELALQSEQIAEHEKITKRMQAAQSMLMSYSYLGKAVRLFQECINYFRENQDIQRKNSCLLGLAEAYVEIAEDPKQIFKELKNSIQDFPEYRFDEIQGQRYLYIKALVKFRQRKYSKSLQLLVQVLKSSQYFCPITREKTLLIIKQILRIKNIQQDKLSELEIQNSLNKDIVLVIDSQYAMMDLDEAILGMINGMANTNHRLCVVQYDQTCKTIFNLTRLMSKRQYYKSQTFSTQGRKWSVMRDALGMAVCQLTGHSSSNFGLQEKWIITLTDGKDNASKVKKEWIQEKFKEYNVHLIGLVMEKDADLDQVRDLVRSSPRGLLFQPDRELHLTRVIEQLLAYIFPRESLSFQ